MKIRDSRGDEREGQGRKRIRSESEKTEEINKRTMMVLYRSPVQTDLHIYC